MTFWISSLLLISLMRGTASIMLHKQFMRLVHRPLIPIKKTLRRLSPTGVFVPTSPVVEMRADFLPCQRSRARYSIIGLIPMPALTSRSPIIEVDKRCEDSVSVTTFRTEFIRRRRKGIISPSQVFSAKVNKSRLNLPLEYLHDILHKRTRSLHFVLTVLEDKRALGSSSSLLLSPRSRCLSSFS